MKLFNRFFALLLVICLLSLVGCGGSDTTSSDNSTTTSDTLIIPPDDSTSSNNSSVSSVISTPDSSSANSSTQVKPLDPTKPTIFLTANKSNNQVTVNINVKNNPGIAAYTIRINYDTDKVTPKTITNNLTAVTSNLQQPNVTLHGYVTAVYANTDGVSKDGVLFSITFDIDYAEGETDFTITAGNKDFVKPDFTSINFQKQNTKISLK